MTPEDFTKLRVLLARIHWLEARLERLHDRLEHHLAAVKFDEIAAAAAKRLAAQEEECPF